MAGLAALTALTAAAAPTAAGTATAVGTFGAGAAAGAGGLGIGSLVGLGSTVLGMYGQYSQMRQQRKAAEIQAQGIQRAARDRQVAAEAEARQLEQQAKMEQAAGQRRSLDERRRKILALSTLQSRAAGSGFDPTDKTTEDIAGEIDRYGTWREQMAMAGGEYQAGGTRARAGATRYNAAAGVTGAGYEAAGIRASKPTVLSGFMSMADRFVSSPWTQNTFGGGSSYRYA